MGAHSLSAVKRGTGLKPKTVLVSERLSSHPALGSLGHQFITKGDNSGTATKKIHRARYEGSGEEFPYPLWVHHCPGISMCSITWKSGNDFLDIIPKAHKP